MTYSAQVHYSNKNMKKELPGVQGPLSSVLDGVNLSINLVVAPEQMKCASIK